VSATQTSFHLSKVTHPLPQVASSNTTQTTAFNHGKVTGNMAEYSLCKAIKQAKRQ
jgi:hypothetical protein